MGDHTEKVKLEPQEEYQDYRFDASNYLECSMLATEEVEDTGVDSDSRVHHLQNFKHDPFSISPTESEQEQQLEEAPVLTQSSPLLTPPPLRRGTPCRAMFVAHKEKNDSSPVISTDKRMKLLSKIPFKRGGSFEFRRPNCKDGGSFMRCLQFGKMGPSTFHHPLPILLKHCGVAARKFLSFTSIFGPGLLLSVAIYKVALWVGDNQHSLHSSSHITSTDIVRFNNPLTRDPQHMNLNVYEQQDSLHEMCSFITEKSDICPCEPSHIINLTNQCHFMYQEYEEKVQVLESEIMNLRNICSEKLAMKEENLNQLIRSIKKFRMDHLSVLKTTLCQYLLAFVVITIFCICYCVRHFTRNMRIQQCFVSV